MKNYEVLKGLNTRQLADFLSTNTSCEFCKIQCEDIGKCPSVASCMHRWEEWLLAENTELLSVFKGIK